MPSMHSILHAWILINWPRNAKNKKIFSGVIWGYCIFFDTLNTKHLAFVSHPKNVTQFPFRRAKKNKNTKNPHSYSIVLGGFFKWHFVYKWLKKGASEERGIFFPMTHLNLTYKHAHEMFKIFKFWMLLGQQTSKKFGHFKVNDQKLKKCYTLIWRMYMNVWKLKEAG